MDILGMRELVDEVEFQEWRYVFEWSVPFLHDLGEQGFIINLRKISFRVDKVSLSEILQVKKATIKSVVNKSLSKNFLEEAGKLKKLNPLVVSKKPLKGQYQLYFEFVNKVLLPRIEKRTIATMVDLYLMEKLSTMVPKFACIDDGTHD